MRYKWTWVDLLVLVILVLTSLYYFIGFQADLRSHPYEDAAILMRYAEHLAGGHGIVWNIGEPPVDGATDFLFMVSAAGLIKSGLSVESAIRAITIASHILTGLLIYITARRFHRVGRYLALLVSVFFLVGPGLNLIATYFGTPFFCLFVAISWYFANHLAAQRYNRRTAIAFAFSCLIMGLIRPEGVFLAIFMLLAVIYRKGFTKSRANVLWFVLVFAILGGGYFLWRWQYFGHPLPNPFYKKGSELFYPESLKISFRNILAGLGPFLCLLVFGFRSKRQVKWMVFMLIPAVGFGLLWGLLSDEMNLFGRFQYPVFVIVLMSLPRVFRHLRRDLKLRKFSQLSLPRKTILVLAAVLFGFSVLYYQYSINWRDRRCIYHLDGRYDIARLLSKYSDKGYTVATTEAGLLPLYSKWKAIDTWGLNDHWIAINGGITEAYLGRVSPELIIFHTHDEETEPWGQMVKILKKYAEKRGYILAAVYGPSRSDTHHYYVKPDFTDSKKIIGQIRQTPYYWFFDGKITPNRSSSGILKPPAERTKK